MRKQIAKPARLPAKDANGSETMVRSSSTFAHSKTDTKINTWPKPAHLHAIPRCF
jgi:hypothetical protein